MKAEDRHRLKQNELAAKFEELPEYFRQQGSKWLIGLLVLLFGLAGGFWWRNAKRSAVIQRSDDLQSLVVQVWELRSNAAQRSQSGAQSSGTDPGQFVEGSNRLAASLAGLAEQGPGSGVARTALLEEAKILRSQLYFSDRQLTAGEKESLCDRAEKVYQTILREFATDKLATGTAKLGLGLLAEDRGQWNRAKEIYQEIADAAEGKWAGTIFPFHAKDRLALIGEISVPIVFSAEPPKPETDITSPRQTDAGLVPGVLDFFMGQPSETRIDIPDSSSSVDQDKIE